MTPRDRGSLSSPNRLGNCEKITVSLGVQSPILSLRGTQVKQQNQAKPQLGS